MSRHERLELGDELACAAACKVGVDPVLDCLDVQLLQSADLFLCKALVGEVGERRSTPQTECRAELFGRLLTLARGECGSPLCHRMLEPVAVQLVRSDLQGIRAPDRPQRLCGARQLLPKGRDAVLQDLRDGRRWAL